MGTAITSFQYPDGSHSPLSNFFPAPLHHDGIGYPTLEHAFQAAKTTDRDLRSAIAQAPNPAQAKRLGRSVQLRPHWEAIKLDVMRALLAAKFARGAAEGAYLLGTGAALLVEGNHWGDQFWGQCPVGTGANWLGVLLMARRAELAAGQAISA